MTEEAEDNSYEEVMTASWCYECRNPIKTENHKGGRFWKKYHICKCKGERRIMKEEDEVYYNDYCDCCANLWDECICSLCNFCQTKKRKDCRYTCEEYLKK